MYTQNKEELSKSCHNSVKELGITYHGTSKLTNHAYHMHDENL